MLVSKELSVDSQIVPEVIFRIRWWTVANHNEVAILEKCLMHRLSVRFRLLATISFVVDYYLSFTYNEFMIEISKLNPAHKYILHCLVTRVLDDPGQIQKLSVGLSKIPYDNSFTFENMEEILIKIARILYDEREGFSFEDLHNNKRKLLLY